MIGDLKHDSLYHLCRFDIEQFPDSIRKKRTLLCSNISNCSYNYHTIIHLYEYQFIITFVVWYIFGG